MLSGKRIREERKKHGYTQEELGKLLNVSKVSVCGYENGTRTPTLDVFRRLVDVLVITPDYALGNDVDVIYEAEEKYTTKLAKEDIAIINELKKHPKLYHKFCEDPKRLIDVINRKINL